MSAATRRVLVEACVDSVESALAAAAGGAGRIELCAGLVEGGTTPSAGTIGVVRQRVELPLFVLVRPRGGDFIYGEDELATMLRDIAVARSLGADGIVAGAMTADGKVDVPTMRRLLDAARPLPVTFHRAIDLARDPMESLETLLVLGIRRVLTAGGAATAREGAGTIARMVSRAGDSLVVMAGGGITEENAAALVAATGVREVHARAATTMTSAARHRRLDIPLGRSYVPESYDRVATSEVGVRGIVEAVRAV